MFSFAAGVVLVEASAEWRIAIVSKEDYSPEGERRRRK
jgi:hypothetical protein